MAIDFPFTETGFCPTQIQWGASPRTLISESVLNGGIQTQGMPGKRWSVSIVLPATTNPKTRARVEAFIDGLNGQEVRVKIWNFTRVGLTGRGSPMGTINTSGLQVNANTAQFATSLPVKGAGASKTLEPGDMLKVGSQLIMVPALITADGSGVISVPVTGGLRAAAVANQSVTVVKPYAEFVLADPNWRSTYNPGVAPEFGVDFVEVFP